MNLGAMGFSQMQAIKDRPGAVLCVWTLHIQAQLSGGDALGSWHGEGP